MSKNELIAIVLIGCATLVSAALAIRGKSSAAVELFSAAALVALIVALS